MAEGVGPVRSEGPRPGRPQRRTPGWPLGLHSRWIGYPNGAERSIRQYSLLSGTMRCTSFRPGVADEGVCSLL